LSGGEKLLVEKPGGGGCWATSEKEKMSPGVAKSGGDETKGNLGLV